jgi:hypothetical protein
MPIFRKTINLGDRVQLLGAFSDHGCSHLNERGKVVALALRDDGSGVMTATVLLDAHRSEGTTHLAPTDWLERL